MFYTHNTHKKDIRSSSRASCRRQTKATVCEAAVLSLSGLPPSGKLFSQPADNNYRNPIQTAAVEAVNSRRARSEFGQRTKRNATLPIDRDRKRKRAQFSAYCLGDSRGLQSQSKLK
ncbi:hypothetical protein PoB_006655200 [Plakobranchus ocellatus]|uniref:Uncharacterized protein n=1 Tax=Plakobranchus ocellatus TaxID=259542 RepID=A0AAV4D7C7_9GAST|nr:hypothetical protein PoB_006655200 [Plakobranchus ocellatus]